MKLITLLFLLSTTCAHSATHYFVRHAEKITNDPANKNPELTLKGQQRAQNLALLLSQADIEHIYSTAYKRTELTAQPLSDRLGIPLKHYDPRALELLVKELKGLQGNTLTVGHSNTTTEAVSLLTLQTMNGLTEEDYGDVFQVVIEGDKVVLNHLKLPPDSVLKVNSQPINTK
ncbi:SixA phosphatase family protein [Marinicella rhabdoformis]|uniref:SixA phosphatase family protein n=1 Tax=Marinicella rhabdoformis TaxID=2580566 RepID=UPI0012AEC355|nr:histidine phosphatase family protein [Marinicella rhabdoformis]